ncbi:tRNA (guanosine(37)-N1)-methyltransferase TrmD [bacterium]|nr:tRNA (guanosine(37)-N1)-methyltransferase TrmD [bacterium]
MQADIITIFPEMIRDYAHHSLLGRAQGEGVLDLEAHDLRKWALGSHRMVDDTPYGGGAGMVMKPEPFFRAVDEIVENRWAGEKPQTLLLSPQGERLDQGLVEELAEGPGWILMCGRYEGVDERVRTLATREISLGDFVVMGGEVAALTLLEGTVRLQEGFLSPESLTEESFSGKGLEYPHYTRPREYRGLQVPPVLLGGNHKEVANWRQNEATKRTRARRPDLVSRSKR